MKAAIIAAKGRIEVREVEEAPPGPGEVLVAVARAGICGSDLHFYRGEWRLPKTAPGHELSGTIAAIGEGVTGWAVGDRVTAECFGHCGACKYCRSGQYNHCENIRWGTGAGHGAMSQRGTFHASALYGNTGLSDDQGVLVEPLAVGIRAAARLGEIKDAGVAVIGGGTIGQLSALAAKAFGAGTVVLFARYPHQAAVAERLGLDEARLEPPAKDEVYPFVIDSIASNAALQQACDLVAVQGRIVEVGCATAPAKLNLAALLQNKEAFLTGAKTYSRSKGQADFARAITWLREGTVDPTPIITHRFPLAQAGEAFRAANDKQSGAVKVLLLPD